MQVRQVFPRWIWFVYALLLVLSIPWYIPPSWGMSLMIGLPTWLIISVAMVILAALFTLWLVRQYWKD